MRLLHSAQDKCAVDNIKAQKLTFISEIEGAKQNLIAAHFPFFRFTYGPYSKELANEVRFLETLCFVDSESRELTDRAKLILRYIQPEIEKSEVAQIVLRIVDEVCEEYKRFESFPTLVNLVYEMVVPVVDWDNTPTRIKDIPECVDILRPDSLQAREVLPLPWDLIEDLKSEFSLSMDELGLDSPEMQHFLESTLLQAIEA